VWKACERCRMKKTKCDGESPCKRCRNDGEVCVSGNRKKAEFKPAPKGYAERLETSQQALKSTVLKLYSMVRNHESWDLGEPTRNDSGQPAIHDIVSKLGCIRDSPDLPTVFPETANDFAELRAQLQAAEDKEDRKTSVDSPAISPALVRSSSESGSSSGSCHSTPDSYEARYEQSIKAFKQEFPDNTIAKSSPISIMPVFDDSYQIRNSFDPPGSLQSPVFPDYQIESPMYPHNESHLNPWAAGDDSLGPAGPLNMTSQLLRQQQQQQSYMNIYSSTALNGSIGKWENSNMGFSDGTIQPNILLDDYNNTAFDVDMFNTGLED